MSRLSRKGMWRNGNRPRENAPEAGLGVGNPCWFGNLPLPSHGRFLLDLNPALRGFFLSASCHPARLDDESSRPVRQRPRAGPDRPIA